MSNTQTIDWSNYAAPASPAGTAQSSPQIDFSKYEQGQQQSQQAQPGFGARVSQAALGTQTPWDQAKKEWSDFVSDPIGSLTNAAKQAAMMPVNLAYQAVHHPLDLSEQIMPVNRAIADAKNSNLSGAAGDIVGGLINTVPAALAGGGQSAAEKVGASLKAPADATAAAADFQKAIPATKSTPYTVEQYTRARPYLEAEHAESPIGTDTGVFDTRDAADSAISKIEDKVAQAIQKNPQDRITTSPLNDVKTALAQNKRGPEFVNAGLSEIKALGLDQPLTVQEADQIRRQLNLENQAALSKNNYKLEAARVSDPAFAAREAASQSLRNGIYGKLEQRGIEGVQDLRQDEGALIAIRNAAQDQIFNGEKIVSGSSPNGLGRQTAAALTRAGATGAGAALGGPTGAIIGAGAGELAARFFTPENLTRNELAARSFSKQVAGSPEYLSVPESPQVRGLLGSGPSVTPAPADASGPVPFRGAQTDPSTRAARLGLLLGPKPGEPLVTPPPSGPLQLPQRSGAPLFTASPRESLLDYLQRTKQ
jgi:hypothetical protein